MSVHKSRLVNLLIFGMVILFSMSLFLFQGAWASENDKRESMQLVEKARMTLQNFMFDKNMGAFRKLVQKAQGVMIVPSLLKGAFIVGASGGSGVLYVRDKTNGEWSGPAFYTLGGASFGFQIGGQSSQVMLLAMTDRGVTSFLGSGFKLGGDVGVAVGPIGAGASAATANLSADIVSFSISKGLYGGISLDGAVVAVRHSLNSAYYGRQASPTQILITHAVKSPHSNVLAESVARAARGIPFTGKVSGEATGKEASQ